ncbi:hypothetical protein RKD27_009355 [Streptomyces sp. SAI-126]
MPSVPGMVQPLGGRWCPHGGLARQTVGTAHAYVTAGTVLLADRVLGLLKTLTEDRFQVTRKTGQPISVRHAAGSLVSRGPTT